MSSSSLLSRVAHIYLLSLLISLAAFPIRAQSTTLIIGTGDEQRRVTLERTIIEDTPYLSLPMLMEEIGGAYNLLPTRVRVDYNGTPPGSLWMTSGCMP